MTKCEEEDYEQTYREFKEKIAGMAEEKQLINKEIFIADFFNLQNDVGDVHRETNATYGKEIYDLISDINPDCSSNGVTREDIDREIERCKQLSDKLLRDRSHATAINKIKMVKVDASKNNYTIILFLYNIWIIYLIFLQDLNDIRPQLDYYIASCKMQLKNEYYSSKSPNMLQCVEFEILKEQHRLEDLSNSKVVLTVVNTMAHQAERCYHHVTDMLNNHLLECCKSCVITEE